MSKQTKTWTARILNAASKEKSINSSVLRTRLRISSKQMDNESFHNTVMRTARYLAGEGLLKQVDRGTFSITKKGAKAANA